VSPENSYHEVLSCKYIIYCNIALPYPSRWEKKEQNKKIKKQLKIKIFYKKETKLHLKIHAQCFRGKY